ncbi:hypothetical protein GY45DRAFT_1320897 [Cubamyces sp. BRFM 1775]|nr:hypothetical protein GY45DRAFT_1320897 [Cubamyces sp. BRFM 1775]
MPSCKPTHEPLDPFDKPLPQSIVEFARYKPLPYPACGPAADDYFAVWRIRTQDLLGACGRWSIVTGEDSCPTIDTTMSAEEKARTKRRIDRWKQRDREARFLILQKLADGYVPETEQCATAKELWDRILTEHKTVPHMARPYRIYARMFERARNCPPNMTLVKRVLKCLEDNAALQELGQGVDDGILALMALASFPTEDPVVRNRINSLEDAASSTDGKGLSTREVMRLAAELDALNITRTRQERE